MLVLATISTYPRALVSHASIRPTLLITGASGYLGRHLLTRRDQGRQVVGTYLSATPPLGVQSHKLEIRDEAAVRGLLERVQPAVVIHTAYRRDEPEVTLDGTRHLARACADVGARLIFISTDLVFDGQRGEYRETDRPNPLDSYGAAKVAAEREVLQRGGVVTRTSLIYGFDPLDPITERLIAAPLRQGQHPRLFVDEYRSPAYGPDLAEALLELAAGSFDGLLHLAGPQRLSRYEFGLKLADYLGLDPGGIKPTRIAESGLIRPADCSLDCRLAASLLRSPLRSVDEVIASRPRVGAPFRPSG
jgi:dTDP-4-dehydrorhamnose reductase